MKSKTIKSLPMRPILLLLLFVSGFAYADPIITTPPPYQLCDDNNDGFTAFDLHTKDVEIIMGQPNLVISYYETMTDAQLGVNEIFGSIYYNINPHVQTVYVRATDTTDFTFAVTTMDLLVHPRPTANQPGNLAYNDIPFDGIGIFDLSTTGLEILGGQTGVIITYYASLADAQNNMNPIANPTSYINITNPQTIFAKAENGVTYCSDITSFQIYVTNPDIVYIPDPNFKFELVQGNIATDINSNPVVLDANGDGEIQVAEALLAYRLDPINIATTTYEGIRSFSNLQVFYTPPGCNINTLDVSGLQNLKDLQCQYNQLHTLNISNCPALERLFCGGNYWIGTLDLTGKPNLKNVWCEQNQISSLDVTGAPLLQYLSCRDNSLSTLNLTNNTALTDLNCGMNLMTSIDVSHCTNLVNFHCAAMAISALDLTGLNSIANLNVRFTNITSLDVSNLPNLTYLDCDGNLLTELDLSHNPVLCSFQCSNSNTLNYLNLKNGGTCNSAYMITANPNLQFVCADEDEADYYQNYFIGQGMPTVVNSYCTFIPGGNFNTISGNITFDANNDGCGPGDLTQSNIRININDSAIQGATFSDSMGNYKFYTQAGSFDVTPAFENSAWFTFTPPSATIPFADNNNNAVTQNFCIVANGVHPDLEVVIAPITPARPGFNAVYKIIYKNKGNQVMSQASYGLNFFYNQNLMSVVTTSVVPAAQLPGSLSWNYANLMPFESRSITVTFLINTPTDTNPVNNGDILTFNTVVFPQAGDENINDNTFVYNQTVVGSFDPNEITCLEGDLLSPTEIGKYLHYAIGFENTGNYPAENVVVKDVIDTAKYDISSLQLLSTSHASYIKITGNVAEFIFKDINLAALAGHPPVGGHGDVLFKIKSKNDLIVGDYVSKTAKIYFDYNVPITTNDAETTYQSLSNPIHELDNSITVYPNPAKTIINIGSKFNIKTVQLFDIQGRLLETDLADGTTATFDISNNQNGVYFLKITTDNGSKIEKVVKE